MSVRRHTLMNLGGYLVPAALSLLTVPAYLHLIGTSRYGLWVIFWTFLNYFSFVDLGLPRAVAREIARASPGAAGRDVFWTGFWVNQAMAWMGALVVYASAGPLLSRLFHVEADASTAIAACRPWLAAWLPVTAIGSVALGALEGQERFGTINLLQLLGFATFQIAPLLAVWNFGPDLSLMLGAAVCTRGVFAASQWLAATQGLGSFRPRPIATRRLREWLSFGAWSSLISLANPIMESVDRMLIGATLGTRAVAVYSVPFGLTDKFRILPDALQRSLFPRLSRHADPAAARAEAGRALPLLILAMTGVLAPALFVIGPFLELWVGHAVAGPATPLAQLFLVGMWCNAPVYVARVLLQSRGEPAVVARVQLLEFLPYVAVVWLALREFGLPGAALAWVLRSLFESAVLLYRAELLGRALAPVAGGLSLLLAAFALARMAEAPLYPALWYSLAIGLCVLLMYRLLYSWGLPGYASPMTGHRRTGDAGQ